MEYMTRSPRAFYASVRPAATDLSEPSRDGSDRFREGPLGPRGPDLLFRAVDVLREGLPLPTGNITPSESRSGPKPGRMGRRRAWFSPG